MTFASPYWILLAIPLGLVIWKTRNHFAGLAVSRASHLRQLEDVQSEVWDRLKWAVRLALIGLILFCLMQPRGSSITKEVDQEGVDIMLVLDVSDSMRAEDFEPNNRLMVAKRTLKDFIRKRETDQIGLVAFSSKALTLCPLTSDYQLLKQRVDEADFSLFKESQTAIGLALATAVNRLKESKAKSKVIVLLTDGENNAGGLSPLEAASLARAFQIKVYTVGVGQEGGAPVPFLDENGEKIYQRLPTGEVYLPQVDEQTLKEIAVRTEGKYFRARDEIALKSIYNEIDRLEKTMYKTKIFRQYEEYFPSLLLFLFLGLGVEFVVFRWILRVWP